MANRYIQVPREVLAGALEGAGFLDARIGSELMYYRRHVRDPRLRVEVLTSIPVHGATARPKDADAIRVTASFHWTRQGETQERRKVLFRAKILRVNSVDGVVERTIQAARDGYATCNRWLQEDWAKKQGKK